MEQYLTNHIAILLVSRNEIDLSSILGRELIKKTAFFSEDTIQKLIREEVQHDDQTIFDREGQSLRSMSSGERKIALVKYLMSKTPAYLVIEHLSSNLDPSNKKRLASLLSGASEHTKIIQLVRTKDELLPFITSLFVLENDSTLRRYEESLDAFFDEQEKPFSALNIPETTTRYDHHYNTLIKFEGVHVSFFGKPILRDIHWEIKLGQFWHLVGENGSGKTTLLSLITGDSPKAYGQPITLFDKVKGTEENVWEIKQKIGYFTPSIAELFARRSSTLHMIISGFYDSIGLYVKPQEIHLSIAKQWLALLGMEDDIDIPFTTLSMAKQRMVLIARAMVKHPPLLILDEPTAGLDKESTRLIVGLINKIAAETKTSIIYVSHTIEKGLRPDHIYALEKHPEGSIGRHLKD